MRKYIFYILLICPLLAKALEIQTLKGEFTQIREQAMFAEPQESKGVFYFVADSLLRWEYTTPSSFGIIANGKDVKLLRNGIVSPSNNANALQNLVNMIMQTINGIDTDNNPTFDIITEQQDNDTILVLTPKKRSNRAAFTRMEIRLDRTGVLAKEVKMQEKSGDTTTIIFYNLQINQTIEKSLF